MPSSLNPGWTKLIHNPETFETHYLQTQEDILKFSSFGLKFLSSLNDTVRSILQQQNSNLFCSAVKIDCLLNNEHTDIIRQDNQSRSFYSADKHLVHVYEITSVLNIIIHTCPPFSPFCPCNPVIPGRPYNNAGS